jgi:hypothetical protein
MPPYRISVIGGWCGNRLFMVTDHISERLEKAGFHCQVKGHSVWDNYSQPPTSNLILQLLPAFSVAEAGCPVINIKPLLLDLDHPQTMEKIFAQVESDFAPPPHA